MTISEVERLVDEVYANVGVKYRDIFQNVIGGCHCTPPTEWLGDTMLAFKTVLNEDSITNSELKAKAQSYVSNWRL